MFTPKIRAWLPGICGCLLIVAGDARATDIFDVQPASLDQPRINAMLSLTAGGAPLTANFGSGIDTFNIQAFLDTGASGVLLSLNTADFLGVTRSTHNGQDVVFSDVGVGGSVDFNVSNPLHIRMAPYSPSADIDNPSNYLTVYNQTIGATRLQVGPLNAEPNPLIGDLDVFGMPVMQNKVVVMDARPVNTFVDTMRTYIYDPTQTAQIPSTSYHIKLTKADFAPYTQTTPTGAAGPTLNGNPFIGVDPTHPNNPGSPKISLSFDGAQTQGSFLLDTGAAASMISSQMALNLGITIVDGPNGPVLMHANNEIEDQFTLTIGGIGGEAKKVAGFFLDTLLVPTQEGILDAGASNLNFVRAPVLVNDITVMNPTNSSTLTLDGIFGMNFLVASINYIETGDIPIITALASGAFDTIVYNDQTSTLGVTLADPTLIDPSMYWLGDTNENSNVALWNFTSRNWFDLIDIFNERYRDGSDVAFVEADDTTVQLSDPVSPNSVLISNSNTYIFQADPFGPDPTHAVIQGAASVLKDGPGVAIFQMSNTYTGLTDIKDGTLVFSASQNIGPVLVRQDGQLTMEASQHLDGMTLLDGHAKLSANGSRVLRITSLEIIGSGQLDITNNAMIIENESITDSTMLRTMLRGGRNDGSWDGAGLMSSSAAADPLHRSIGFLDNRFFGLATFAGQSVDPQALLVKYTWAGDANLDGRVDIRDLVLMLGSWMDDDSFWYEGDFNYDGMVDRSDLGIFARNWQQGTGNFGGGLSLSQALLALGLPDVSVPEPANIAAMLLFLAAGFARPRRRSPICVAIH